MHGYTDGSYDYKQKYDIKDLRGPLPKPVIYPNTILNTLVKRQDCQGFTNAVMSIPDISARFNDTQSSMTLFVPVYHYIPSGNSFTERQRILLHSLEYALAPSFFEHSRMIYVNTKLTGSKVLVESINGVVVLDRHAQIISSEPVGSNMIYYITQPLVLDGNPLADMT